MFLEPTASGVRCPFHDAFNFTYNDMTSDFCAKMESYAKPCVSETRYQLLFRHCTGSALYNEKGGNRFSNTSLADTVVDRRCTVHFKWPAGAH